MRFAEILERFRDDLERRARRKRRPGMPAYGTPEFTALVTPKGVNVAAKEKARRRAANKRARASRKRNRRG